MKKIEDPEELVQYIKNCILKTQLAGYSIRFKDSLQTIMIDSPSWDFYSDLSPCYFYNEISERVTELHIPKNIAREHIWRSKEVESILVNYYKCIIPTNIENSPVVFKDYDVRKDCLIALELDTGKTKEIPSEYVNKQIDFYKQILKESIKIEEVENKEEEKIVQNIINLHTGEQIFSIETVNTKIGL